MNPYTEDALVEQPAIRLFQDVLGWETFNAYHERLGAEGELGREHRGEVVLAARLRAALRKLNPQLPQTALDLALAELTRPRATLPLVAANQDVYKRIREGVKVTFKDVKGRQRTDTVRVLDWEHPHENDFLLVSQLWVTGPIYTRRTDLVGFINGLPLVFIELKASHKKLQAAYNDNLRDYKETIPQLFWYNGLVILSNGSATRLGSLSAEWEHFNEWKRVNDEGEKGVISLDTALRGVCDKARLLDILENFILFTEGKDGLKKLVPRNHQFLGVNNAFEKVKSLDSAHRLGVFWHTQGSGKSYSMIYFAQKVRRRLPGNWTFVIVTDRNDLDRQIYNNFAAAGAVTEPEQAARAGSIEHLRQMLAKEDHRYVFTTIQKFGTQRGEPHPRLSDRSDIIVMTDEAHRSQYDALAMNMRNALPNAAFIGFTGTPLMAGEELTKQVFGDYVSVYNFKQSVEDNATVPLYYENRIPELQLTNQTLNPQLEEVLERAELEEEEEEKLAREFPHEYDLITRTDRLEKIAEDIVLHFMGRGFPGKAMVVSIDKATAVSMYERVRKHWRIQLALLENELDGCDPMLKPDIEAKIAFMRETDMAVVISQSQNEIADMRKKGLEIQPHRERMLREDLDEKFKDSTDPLRLVFVCAMWMTGFDVPSCSTIYLDKPMRNHTLMQTIARANRVFGEKVNGLIVDYIGIFKDLKKALAIYGAASGGGIQEGEMPVAAKQVLVDDLRAAIKETASFLRSAGTDLAGIVSAPDEFVRIARLDDATDAILVNDASKSRYLTLAGRVEQLFQAILPDTAASQYGPQRKAIQVLAEKVRNNQNQDITDLEAVMVEVNRVLDESIRTKDQYVIREGAGSHILDLSKIDFEALKKLLANSRKNIQIDRLRGRINAQLQAMLRRNKSRIDFAVKFEKLIAEYNAGREDADIFVIKMISFARALNEEEQRGISENLSEEELAIFDLITRPNIKLSKKECEQIKKIARDLLDTLKAERLVLGWRNQQNTRAAVRVAILDTLEQLPEAFTPELYNQKCELVYQHVYEAYPDVRQNLYATEASGQ